MLDLREVYFYLPMLSHSIELAIVNLFLSPPRQFGSLGEEGR